jgi:hypothetical protein
MFTCHEHIMRIFEGANTEVRLLPARHGRVVEPAAILPPPSTEPEKPKRKKVKPPEPVVELPPPPPPVIVPEEEPHRIQWPDPNELFSRAEKEETWFYPTNEHEIPVAKAPTTVVAHNLPDYWPVAPIPAPVEELTLAPEPVKVSRIDPPAPPKVIRRRRPRFTWGSPELYWEEEDAVVSETGSRKTTRPSSTEPLPDDPWSGWDL